MSHLTFYLTNIAIHYATLHNAGGQSSNDVLEFSAEEQKWTNVGSMLKKREEHAVSVINYNAIKAYCN